MSSAHQGNPRSERLPAVFDDRVIFGYPDPASAHPPPKSSAASAILATVAIMMIPLAFLGWLTIDALGKAEQGGAAKVETLEGENKALKADLEAQKVRVAGLELEVNAFRSADTASKSIANLLYQREELIRSARAKLPTGAETSDPEWQALKHTPPDWDKAAIQSLTDQIVRLRAYEKKLQARLDARPVSRPVTPGAIEPGRDD